MIKWGSYTHPKSAHFQMIGCQDFSLILFRLNILVPTEAEN